MSIPNILKWKIKTEEEICCLFSDCFSLLYIPNISIWKNYNDNYKPNYFQINNIFNFSNDIFAGISNDYESFEILNGNNWLYKEETNDKFDRFYT